MALIAAGGLLGISGSALGASNYGYQSISYSGVSNPPTSDKPQSKLWWTGGSWWADMWTSGKGWQIYRLDVPSKTWVSTGLTNDTRASTLADTLWDGSKLYIASHVVTVSGDTSPKVSVSGQPAKLYRYSFSGGKFTLDSGFPTTIANYSSESMTIAKDTTGAIWATWTQVSGSSTSGYKNTVYVNRSAAGGTSWNTPFVLPVANPTAAPDDISTIVAYGKNKIGVMWSDQLTGAIRWATRTDGTSTTASSSWRGQDAIKGSKLADDHLNIKAILSDSAGRVYAAIKTGTNDTSSNKTLPQLLLLVFKPSTGAFTKATIATIGDCVSRPQIVLDTQNNTVHAFHTAPSTGVTGCAYSGVPGAIYEKTASMDNPVFTSGRGTPIIQDGASSNMNDVTTSKQSVNSTTGLAVLASNNVTKRYWFSYKTLGTSTPPPPPPSSSITTVASTTRNVTTTTSTVTLNKPSGTAARDVLVASFTADKNPTISTPSGWTPIVNGLSVTTGARVFSYYRVVGSSDPASYSWTMSTAVKWGGGVTAYRGVNNTTPLDSSVVTAVNTSYTATSIAGPSVTTASNNAMLIGGVGFDSSTPGATAPSGWTERWESTDGQIAEQADRAQTAAGASGTATWTFNTAKAVGVWRTALKPAS